MPESTTEAELAELAITVYIEELATDKRVLYVGDPQSRGPDRLAKVARSVELISPQARARGTRRGSRVQPRRWPDEDDLGRWDLVVVPDVDAAGLCEEQQVEKIGAWLAEGGVLVAATSGTERGLSYEGLFDLLQVSFDSVRMVGHAPFRGFSLVDFAPPGEPGVTFDGSLLDGAGEQAQRFLALCGDEDVVLDAYAVVQIPSSSSSSSPAAPPRERERMERAEDGTVSQLNERVREQQDALDAANVHSEDLERELDSLRDSLADTESDLAQAARRAEEASRAQKMVEAARRALSEQLKEEREASRGELKALRVKAEKRRAPAPSPAAASDAEYARLETQLRESGQQLTDLQSELARRAVLVRDLIEELSESRGAEVQSSPSEPALAEAPPASEPPASEPPASEPPAGLMSTVSWSADEFQTALREQAGQSAERAMTAETDKAALEFRLDELRGELALVERGRDQDMEAIRRVEAALRGTVRGLNARLAEVTELYQQTQARLTLSADDSVTASENTQDLERELAEAREQLELQLSRANAERAAREQAVTVPPESASASEDLTGELARCREEATEFADAARRSAAEVDSAQREVARVEERVAGLRQGYEVRIAEIVAELDSMSGEAERAWVQNGELASTIDTMERADAKQRGELMGTKLRLADREEAVAALVARAESSPAEPAAQTAAQTVAAPSSTELDALREQLTAAREEAEALRGELADAASQEDEPASKPSGSEVEARNALIARLQGELAQAIGRYHDLESELSECQSALDGHRERIESARIEGAVEAEESVRELDELTTRLEESETERRSAHDALTGAKDILSGLVEGLPEADGEVSSGVGQTAELRTLRERVVRLDAQAADREVIMRSLTAQLQERDDRIRALEVFDPSDIEDPQVLRARTLELEERAARLAEELENERRARRRLEEG